MATSITQAKPLLTASELELFDHSRADPIKSLTAKQLAAKEKRTRNLRDKYRDLYRRQTVAQRGKAGGVRGKAMPPTDRQDKANARTQRKADIMQEVLERFEARTALLEARAERDAGTNKASNPDGSKTADQKSTAKSTKSAAGKPSGSGKAAAPAKRAAAVKKPAAGKATGTTRSTNTRTSTASGSTPANAGASASKGKQAAPRGGPKDNTEVTAAKALKGTKASPGGATKSAAKSKNTPDQKPASKSTSGAGTKGKPTKTPATLSAVNHLPDGANAAVHVEHLTGDDPADRSHKAPSDMAPTHGGKAQAPHVNAPLDIVPSARRESPVRNMPGNIAIQGHISSNVRRAQGKKDSRE